MNQPNASPGPRQSVASAVGSPGVRGIFSRLTSRFTPARGEVSAHRTAARLAWVLWTLSVLLLLGYIPLRYQWQAVASTPGIALPPQDVAALKTNLLEVIAHGFELVGDLIYSTLGALIVSRAQERRIGWLFCTIGLVGATGDFTAVYAVYTLLVAPGSLPASLAVGWMQHWIWIVGAGLPLVFLPLLYPTGRLVSRRWKPVGWFAMGLVAGGTCLAAFAPGPLSDVFEDFQTKIPNPLGIAALGPVLKVIAPIALLLFLLLTFVSATSLLLRLRRATGDERAQLKWFAYIAALLVVLFVLSNLSSFLSSLPTAALNTAFGLFFPPAFAGLPLITGLAILKYRLYAIDRLINRTLVYGTLTASVVGLYVLLVGALGALFRSSDNPLIAILATGLIALLFHPLRQRVQRGINRLMYGERDDPSAVLARLGSRLEGTLAPEAVLPTLVQTVRETLRLPYAAIALQHDETVEVAASAGKPVEDTLRLPLVYQGETVGQLLVGARTPGEAFSAADRRVLHTIAYQAGAAVHTVRLTSELQRSRQHLVTAREEERRRLRRDLHDGLGPILATMAMQAEEARDQLPSAADQSAASLASLITQAHGALDDIRRLVYALRPPALDALGLVGALKEQATQYARQDLSILIDAPEHLPPLPAAVEVAAYRILQEALTNVVRHAEARTCTVSVRFNGTLDLEVTDDGCGLHAACHAGVGLSSIRERAAELGGACEITSTPGRGTCLRTRLPGHIE
jgi:signal transduction histidine kinase